MSATSTTVLIIGAGPAGMTAAIQLKRYGVPFVLLERERIGGLLWNANLVENYPGFPAGVRGPKLVHLIEKQMQRLGIQVTFDEVINVQCGEDNFLTTTHNISSRSEADGTHYATRFLIIASGTKSNPIPLPIPAAARNRVFSEVYPLLEQAGKQIVIIGGGDAAFDYALNLTKNRNSVTILNRGGDVKCLGLLWERAMDEAAIHYRAGIPVSGVTADGTAGRLKVQTDAGEVLEADYLIFAIGRVPQMDFLSPEMAGKQVAGLYFVGDVKNGLFRQAAIAAGDGLRAAMEIYTNLNSEA